MLRRLHDLYGRGLPTLVWFVTERCNARCLRCYQGGNGGGGAELTVDEVGRITTRLGRLTTRLGRLLLLQCSGGESFLREDPGEMLDRFSGISGAVTVQEGIDAASDGDRVVVHDGTYYENIDFSGKDITVESISGPAATAIDGGGSGSVVSFISGETSAAVLDGFTVTNGGATPPDTGAGSTVTVRLRRSGTASWRETAPAKEEGASTQQVFPARRFLTPLSRTTMRKVEGDSPGETRLLTAARYGTTPLFAAEGLAQVSSRS